MTRFEQLKVILYCSLLATPLLILGAVGACLTFGCWRILGAVAVVALTLMLQPIPHEASTRRGQIGILLCRYFAIEFCVDRESPGVPLSGIGGTRALLPLLTAADAEQQQHESAGVDETPATAEAMSAAAAAGEPRKVVIGGPMINMACPHGVMNFGAVVFTCFSRWLVGADQVTAVAGAVQVTPGLRQFAAPIWPVGASRAELASLLRRKRVIGIIPDGINGIFARKSDGSAGGDAVVVGPKRGLMRLALEHGALIMAAYFVGTLGVYTVWQDRWGLLRWLSRKTRLSLFLFYGRWGLPIPRRQPITAVVAFTPPPADAPLAAPTAEQLDAHHERVYGGLAASYAASRALLGLPEDSSLLIR